LTFEGQPALAGVKVTAVGHRATDITVKVGAPRSLAMRWRYASPRDPPIQSDTGRGGGVRSYVDVLTQRNPRYQR
jgi:hypothetical protein